MAVRSLVTRGFGPGGSIALVVTRGFGAGAAVSAVDEYAAKGWAPRTFYTPYWLGMAPRREIDAAARRRALFEAAGLGDALPAVIAAVEPVAKRQAAKPVGEQAARKQLDAALERAGIPWTQAIQQAMDALRAEHEQVREARREADRLRARANQAERQRLEIHARAEVLRRERQQRVHLAALKRRNTAIALLLSAA